MESSFRVQQNPLSQLRIQVEEEQEEEDYIPSSPLRRMGLGRDIEEGEDEPDDMDLCSSLPRSVATINSFEGRNQDFIRF